MRKLLVGLVIIAVLALASPFVMGIYAEKSIRNVIEYASKESPALDISIKDYHRGWFTSNATVQVKIVPPANAINANNAMAMQALSNMSLNISDTIKHGPIIFSDGSVSFGRAQVDSNMKLDKQYQAFIDMLFAGQKQQPQIQSKLLINFAGNFVSTVDVPAFELTAPNNAGILTWRGLSGKWKLSSELDKVRGKVTFTGVDVTSPQVNLQVADLSFFIKQSLNPIGLWVGEASMKLPLIKISRQGQEQFSLSNLAFSSNSSISDNLLSADMNSSIKKLNVNGQQYGPGEFVSSLKNLDANIVMDLQNQVESMNASGSAEQPQMVVMSILPMLPNLLDKGAEYTLQKFALTIPEGQLNADGFAKIAKGDGSLTIQNLPTRLQAKLNVQLPVTFASNTLKQYMQKKLMREQALAAYKQRQQAKQEGSANVADSAEVHAMSPSEIAQTADLNARQQLDAWVNEGIIIKEGDSFKMTFAFDKGQATINGKALPGVNMQ